MTYASIWRELGTIRASAPFMERASFANTYLYVTQNPVTGDGIPLMLQVKNHSQQGLALQLQLSIDPYRHRPTLPAYAIATCSISKDLIKLFANIPILNESCERLCSGINIKFHLCRTG